MFECSYKAGADLAKVFGSVNVGTTDKQEATVLALEYLQNQFKGCGYWIQITGVDKY